MRITLAATVLVLLPLAAHAQTATPTPVPFASDQRPMLISPASVADPDGADAIIFNPAGLDLDKNSQAVWIHSDAPHLDRAGNGDAFFFKSSRLFNLGMEWARPQEGVVRPLFTLSTAVPMGETFSAGIGFTNTLGKTFSPYSMDTWNFGALWRPANFVSVGGTIWNGFREQSDAGLLDLRPRYAGAVAIRPMVNFLTLSVDAARTDGANWTDLRYAARIEPLPGLSLYGTGDNSHRYSAGLAFSFTHLRVGTTAFQAYDGTYAGTATRIQSSERRQPTVAKFVPSYARMTIGGAVPDESGETLFSSGVETLPAVLRTLAAIRNDDSLDGVIIHLEGFSGGIARAQELREALLQTHAAGKKVLCYMESADFRTYYLASACDRIALHPAGMVEISGHATELQYLKGTLDKVGVEVETARVGPYKAAMEPFIQKEPSPETLETDNAILDTVFGQEIDGIAQGRHLDAAKVRAAVDGAYYDPPGAKAAGLVDYLCYPDELEKTAADYLGKTIHSVTRYGSIAAAPRNWGPDPRIGVIYASGGIAGGDSRSTPFTGESVLGARTLVRQIKKAAADASVKAVVLRIDSPGGDGFASDEVWHEIELLKKKKPVVASMANVAASGGYYIAMGANYILADPGTITGSIGVFLLKPNFKGVFDKIDLHTYALSRGALSQVFTTSRPWTPEERAAAEHLIEIFYTQFATKAAAGRKTTFEAIDSVGRGRVWMGTKAMDLRLVDGLGGLSDAIDKAKELAHIPKARHVEWAAMTDTTHPWDGMTHTGVPAELKAELAAMSLGTDIGTLELLGAFGSGPITFSPEAAVFQPHPQQKTVVPAERRIGLWPIPE